LQLNKPEHDTVHHSMAAVVYVYFLHNQMT